MEKILKHSNYPNLDIGDRQGHTDYIDFINPSELTHPIMLGIDILKRPFIVIKAIGTLNDEMVKFTETFFQRYTENQSLWVGACAGKMFLDTTGGMTDKHFDIVRRLCNHEIIDNIIDYNIGNINNLRLDN